jgi:hypothetical protein
MIALETALEWALRNWRMVLGGLMAAGLLIYAAIQHSSAVHWHKVADQTKAAFDTTVANYRAAADEAKRLDATNVARVKTEQAAINERTVNAYETKLADSASRYDRLRAQASGYLGRPSPTGLPDTREATCQAVAGTGCDAVPALLKAAQDNTDQLVALQGWVREQSVVDVNGPQP